MESPRLVLASTSPYRRNLLDRLRLAYTVVAPQVDEAPLAGEAAPDTALRLAQSKARAGALRNGGGLVIGCDQVAVFDGGTLGKPVGREGAAAQLKAMRGKRVLFHTALALFNADTGAMRTADVPTAVWFRPLTDREIERYLDLEQPYDCAGSAKIEGLGIVLVERIAGDDPSALIGLPLIRLSAMLRAEGVAIV